MSNKPPSGHGQIPESRFALFDTSRDGLPAVVVVNAALLHFDGRDGFPWYLSIIIDPRNFASNGMPTVAESRELDAVGDKIQETVLDDCNAVFLARLTWNRIRQLVLYVHDPRVANDRLQRLLSGPARREWSFRMERDEGWSLAGQYLDLVRTTLE